MNVWLILWLEFTDTKMIGTFVITENISIIKGAMAKVENVV